MHHWIRTFLPGAALLLAGCAARTDQDPAHLGLVRSVDAAQSWQPRRPLVLLDHVDHLHGDREPRLAGIDAAGGVWALESRTGTWLEAGALPEPAQAFTAIGSDRYVAATAAGVHMSEDAGRSWTFLVASAT